jgi:hypothetical protein
MRIGDHEIVINQICICMYVKIIFKITVKLHTDYTCDIVQTNIKIGQGVFELLHKLRNCGAESMMKCCKTITLIRF